MTTLAIRYSPFAIRGPSLGVRLVLRPRLVEGGELEAGGVDRDDLGKLVKRDVEAPCIGDLRNEADVSKADLRAIGVRSRPQQRLDRREADRDPMGVPGVDRLLVVLERVLEIEQRRRIVERMDVAGDRLGDRAHVRGRDRVRRQQRRLGMRLVEVLDDGERLRQHAPAHPHARHAALWIYYAY